jgi:hypothetical protein
MHYFETIEMQVTEKVFSVLMFSIRTCFAVDGACWRSSPSSSLSNNLYIVIALARFCSHAGARPVVHACGSERPHAPPTARMREGGN